MVRYRPEAVEKNYTFRLGSVQPAQNTEDGNSSLNPAVEKERIDSLFRSRSQADIPRRPEKIPEQSQAPTVSGSSADSTIYTRSKSFIEARTAVKANIEKVVLETNRSGRTLTLPSTIKAKAPTPKPVEPVQQPSNPKQNVPLPPIPKDPVQKPAKPPRNLQTSTRIAKESPQSVPKSGSKYEVEYLGSLALQEKATNLECLQGPLKNLYLKYCQSQISRASLGKASLSISETGLKLQYFSDQSSATPTETVNPFPTIAVWAAVRFTLGSEPGQTAKFAFVPLISDNETETKHQMHLLRNAEYKMFSSATNHPPLFACVMRNVLHPQALECHAFVCNSSDDAIVIAANLYQSLLHHMQTLKSQSKIVESQAAIYSPESNVSNRSDCSAVPTRPPRRKKSRPSTVGPSSESNILRRRSLRSSMKRTYTVKADTRRSMRSRGPGVQRSKSERQFSVLMDTDEDIVTKVAIPRSRSFASIPQTYSVGELFEELKAKEGIKSLDDAFKLIVNPEKMSFNELKPAYKEMILKLALTLSKDEMFRRSKNILRSQTVRQNKAVHEDQQRSGSRLGSVLRATKKSFSRWGTRSSNGYSVAAKQTQLRLEAARTKNRPEISAPVLSKIQSKSNVDKQIHDGRCYCSIKSSNQREYCIGSECVAPDKCYCSMRSVQKNGRVIGDVGSTRKMNDEHLNSNYQSKIPVSNGSLISWSMLSAAESPLTGWRKNSSTTLPKNADHSIQLRSYLSDTSLDTDFNESRTLRPDHTLRNVANRNVVSRIRSSSTSLVSGEEVWETRSTARKPSPDSAGYHSNNSTATRISSKSQSCSSENLTSVSSYRSGSKSPQDRALKEQNVRSPSKTVLMVSAIDPKGRVVYRGSSSASSYKGLRPGNAVSSKTSESDLLAVKKTAEIAALFSDLKLNQTTDILLDPYSTAEDSESELSTDDSLFSSGTTNGKDGKFPSMLGNSLGSRSSSD